MCYYAAEVSCFICGLMKVSRDVRVVKAVVCLELVVSEWGKIHHKTKLLRDFPKLISI